MDPQSLRQRSRVFAAEEVPDGTTSGPRLVWVRSWELSRGKIASRLARRFWPGWTAERRRWAMLRVRMRPTRGLVANTTDQQPSNLYSGAGQNPLVVHPAGRGARRCGGRHLRPRCRPIRDPRLPSVGTILQWQYRDGPLPGKFSRGALSTMVRWYIKVGHDGNTFVALRHLHPEVDRPYIPLSCLGSSYGKVWLLR